MTVLVIEYEQGIAEKITAILAGVDETIRVVGITPTMEEAAEWLTRNSIPDLILANQASLPGLPASAKEMRAVVTFATTTGPVNFAALRYKTICQLLEQHPMVEERLLDFGKIWPPTTPRRNRYKERFLVKQGQRLLSIPSSNIAYFFSHERFIYLRTHDNQKFLLEYRIEQLEKMLSPVSFFRINRSFIISLTTVREIHAYFGNRLKLYLSPPSEKEVIVSRKRVNDFKQWLGK